MTGFSKLLQRVVQLRESMKTEVDHVSEKRKVNILQDKKHVAYDDSIDLIRNAYNEYNNMYTIKIKVFSIISLTSFVGGKPHLLILISRTIHLLGDCRTAHADICGVVVGKYR